MISKGIKRAMETMTLEKVCELLKITVQTARNRISLGQPMPPSFKVGRRRLFLEIEVNKWLSVQAGFDAIGQEKPKHDEK